MRVPPITLPALAAQPRMTTPQHVQTSHRRSADACLVQAHLLIGKRSRSLVRREKKLKVSALRGARISIARVDLSAQGESAAAERRMLFEEICSVWTERRVTQERERQPPRIARACSGARREHGVDRLRGKPLSRASRRNVVAPQRTANSTLSTPPLSSCTSTCCVPLPTRRWSRARSTVRRAPTRSLPRAGRECARSVRRHLEL